MLTISSIRCNSELYNIIYYILYIRYSYFGSMKDLLWVSPKGESFGRFMKIKPYATMLTEKLAIITAERLNPLNFAALELVHFLPNTLHSRPPAIVFYIINEY